MTILDNDQRQEVIAKLQGGSEEEDSSVEYNEAADGQAEYETESESDENEDSNDDEESGHAVPYSRFSQVINTRNSLASEAEQNKARITELEEKLQQMENLKQMFGSQDNQGYNNEEQNSAPESEYDELRGAMMKIGEQQQYDMLERELHTVNEKYPNVPSEMLLHAVIDDPSVDIDQLASVYSAHITEVEESAINRYLQEQPGLSSAQSSIPPELGHTGGKEERPGNKSNASSIREVTERLLKQGF